MGFHLEATGREGLYNLLSSTLGVFLGPDRAQTSSPRASVCGGLGERRSQGALGPGNAPCWSSGVLQGPKGGQFQEPRGGSKAEAELLAHAAAVTLHYAAPVEAALAVLLELHALLAVATATAQQVTAAEIWGTAIAGTTTRAGRAGAPIGGAEIRRVGHVEKVGAAWRLERVDRWQQGFAIVRAHDPRGAVEALQQPRTHLAERGQLLPAGAHSA